MDMFPSVWDKCPRVAYLFRIQNGSCHIPSSVSVPIALRKVPNSACKDPHIIRPHISLHLNLGCFAPHSLYPAMLRAFTCMFPMPGNLFHHPISLLVFHLQMLAQMSLPQGKSPKLPDSLRFPPYTCS